MQYCSFRRLQFNVPEKYFIFQVDNALLGIPGKPAVDGLPVGWPVVILIDDNAWDLQEGCPAERDRSVI